MYWLETRFIWFIFYSMVGWVWEVIICSVDQRKFVNRGFLNGPYCPIYGCGSIIVIEILGGIKNPVILFFAAAILTCSLEYFTSWAMEKLFNARWWDYSERFLNLNGRVCLIGAVAFGGLSVLVLLFVHPSVAAVTAMLSETAVDVISLVLFTIFLSDVIFTVTKVLELNTKLRELTEKAKAEQQLHSAKELSAELRQKLHLSSEEFARKIGLHDRRLLKAFPKIRSTRYEAQLQKIKLYISGKVQDIEEELEKHSSQK